MCVCKEECDERCWNRSAMVECDPTSCPVSLRKGGLCDNQRLLREANRFVVVRETKNKGRGLFADENIKKNEFVIEYTGITTRHKSVSKVCTYMMKLDKDRVIDAIHDDNPARYANHSCEPNAYTQVWTVEGKSHVGIFALRNIKKGEEITFNYGRTNGNTKCSCEKKKCRGVF